jgi:hypothetical protein
MAGRPGALPGLSVSRRLEREACGNGKDTAMSKTMITISALNGLILSAAAMGTEENVVIGPNEPKDVPEGYGRHLIADRFAVEVVTSKDAGKPEKSTKASA